MDTVTVYIPVEDYDEDIPASEQDYMSESEAHEMFDDYVDEMYGSIIIMGVEFHASTILKPNDCTDYRCLFADYASAEFVEVEITWEEFVNGL